MALTPTKYYLRNTTTGVVCADYKLSTSTGTGTTVSIKVPKAWELQVDVAMYVAAGTYKVVANWDLGGALGAGSIKCRVVRYNSSCVLQANLLPWTAGLLRADGNHTETWEFEKPSPVPFAADDLIFVEIGKDSGGPTKTYSLNYNDADSYIELPSVPYVGLDLSSDDPVNTLIAPVGPWVSPLVPIAQWLVPGRQRLANGGTLDIGVSAFCKREDTHVQDGGIDKVEITVTPSSGTYDGDAAHVITISTVTQNANIVNVETGVPTQGYWCEIDETKFSAVNPSFTVAAKVYSNSTNAYRDADTNDGEAGLEVLTFFANTNGSLAQRWAYVDKVSGNDGTAVTFASDQGGPGSVANADRWATIHAALVQLGTDGMDGAMVCLLQGQDHVFDDPDGAFSDSNSEWVTIKPWDGTGPPDTRINGLPPNYGVTKVKYIKFDNIKLGTTHETLEFQVQADSEAWFPDCLIECTNQHALLQNHVVGTYPAAFYSTETEVKNARRGLRGSLTNYCKLHRGGYYHHIGEDPMGGRCPCAVNMRLVDCKTQNAAAHPDIMQAYGPAAGFVNVIAADWHVTDYTAIGWHNDSADDPPISGLALVNLYFDYSSTPIQRLALLSIEEFRTAEHVLVWHVTGRYTDADSWTGPLYYLRDVSAGVVCADYKLNTTAGASAEVNIATVKSWEFQYGAAQGTIAWDWTVTLKWVFTRDADDGIIRCRLRRVNAACTQKDVLINWTNGETRTSSGTYTEVIPVNDLPRGLWWSATDLLYLDVEKVSASGTHMLQINDSDSSVQTPPCRLGVRIIWTKGNVDHDTHIGAISVIGCQVGHMYIPHWADTASAAKWACTYNDSTAQATADFSHNNYFVEAYGKNAYDVDTVNGGDYTQTYGHDCSESAPLFNAGSGVPKASSPLARRVPMIVVPFDVAGNPRRNPTAIGAYEADPATLLTVERHRPRGWRRGTLRGV